MKVGLQQVAQIIEKGGEIDVTENSISTVPIGDTSSYKNAQVRTDYMQIKMFWKRGYDWNEGSYCLDCSHRCREGDKVEIKRCNRSSEYQRWVIINTKLRPHTKQDLCLHSDGTKAVRVKECGSSEDLYQKWDINNFGQKFEYQQTLEDRRGRTKKYCLTTGGNPESGLNSRLVRCKDAIRGDRSYWVTGRFDRNYN